jgi:hypothetical protein
MFNYHVFSLDNKNKNKTVHCNLKEYVLVNSMQNILLCRKVGLYGRYRRGAYFTKLGCAQ